MPGVTPLGTIHTSISLVALAAGFACLVRLWQVRRLRSSKPPGALVLPAAGNSLR
ncbi:MAG: hypothetical protein JWQ76_5682 [Ramlibacter sp.]|nr:hypothetical protein [Ramlibacter sp.]